ncbi:MAG: hypothetical protein ACOYUZ_05665 [Patescibacteria group bacterium]
MPETTVVGRGFTEGELKAASWWVRHEVQLNRWSRILLIAFNAIIWGYIIWGLLDAYIISYPRESRITEAIAVNQQNLDRIMQDRPGNVGTGQVLVFQTTEGRVDIAVDIENGNKQWWPEFTYRFNIAGEQTPARQGFIMPESIITLTELGFKPASAQARSAQLIVENIRWHRLDPAEVDGDYNQFLRNRYGDVAVENIGFDPVSAAAGRRAGRTSFDIVNRGAYGYWSIDYVIKLYRGGTVVAVNKVNVRELRPGETKKIDLLWYDEIPSVTKTEVTPIINLLDNASYLPTNRF